ASGWKNASPATLPTRTVEGRSRRRRGELPAGGATRGPGHRGPGPRLCGQMRSADAAQDLPEPLAAADEDLLGPRLHDALLLYRREGARARLAGGAGEVRQLLVSEPHQRPLLVEVHDAAAVETQQHVGHAALGVLVGEDLRLVVHAPQPGRERA